jgi:hypothetical protein
MDAWTTQMRRGRRGCITSALHPGVVAPQSTCVTKEKGRRVMTEMSPRRQREPQLAEAVWERGRWLVGWAALGPKEWSGPVGWLPAHARGKVFLFDLLLFSI